MCASKCTKIAMCTLWTSRIKQQESRLFIPHLSSTFALYSFEKCVLLYQVLKIEINKYRVSKFDVNFLIIKSKYLKIK
jgi:hypothetical protein